MLPYPIYPRLKKPRDAYARNRSHKKVLSQQCAMALIAPRRAKSQVVAKTRLNIHLAPSDMLTMAAKLNTQAKELPICLHGCGACQVITREGSGVDRIYLQLLAEQASATKELFDCRASVRVRLDQFRTRYINLAKRDKMFSAYMRKYDRLFKERDKQRRHSSIFHARRRMSISQMTKEIIQMKAELQGLRTEKTKMQRVHYCCERLRNLTDDALTERFGNKAWYKAGLKHKSLCSHLSELKKRFEKSDNALFTLREELASYKEETTVMILEATKVKHLLFRKLYRIQGEVQIWTDRVDRLIRVATTKAVALGATRYNIIMMYKKIQNSVKEVPEDDTLGQLKQIKKHIRALTEIVKKCKTRPRTSSGAMENAGDVDIIAAQHAMAAQHAALQAAVHEHAHEHAHHQSTD